MKLLSAFAIATLAIAGLTACSSAPQAAACEMQAKSGKNTAAVKVSGQFGTKPTVDFTKGMTATDTQSLDVIKGTGRAVNAGESITIDAQLYDATSGQIIQQTAYDGQSRPTIPVDVSKLGGFSKALICHKVGSRVVAVIGNDQTLATSLGLAKSATVVAVVDIVGANLSKANGAPQPAVDGMPRVVLSDAGIPGITIPKSTAPSKLEVALLKKGDGALVAEHANVTVHYIGVTWANATTPFDSSWSRGTPAEFNVDNVVEGFKQALVGQRVGSQVLAVIPPALGYKDQAAGSIPANSTLVFVIDILGTSK